MLKNGKIQPCLVYCTMYTEGFKGTFRELEKHKEKHLGNTESRIGTCRELIIGETFKDLHSKISLYISFLAQYMSF